MQNCPRQLAMQSCVLCSFVRCGTSNQIGKKRRKKKTIGSGTDFVINNMRALFGKSCIVYAYFGIASFIVKERTRDFVLRLPINQC